MMRAGVVATAAAVLEARTAAAVRCVPWKRASARAGLAGLAGRQAANADRVRRQDTCDARWRFGIDGRGPA